MKPICGVCSVRPENSTANARARYASPFLAVLRRRLLAFFLGLGACCFAMLLSYGMVRWLTQGMADEVPLNPVVQQRAILLRGFANDLTRACNDYAHHTTGADGRISADGRLWIERVFRSELRFLEQRMDNNAMPAIASYLTLRAAAQRCTTMARYPDDVGLRRAALKEARQAIEAVNAYLETIDMARSAGRAPVSVQFGQPEN